MSLLAATFGLTTAADKLDERTASAIQEFLYGPYVSYGLYSAIALAFVGIVTKFHKFTAAGGLAIILICAFRAFSTQLTSATWIFQSNVIIPIFTLTILSKFVTDYIKKKIDKKKELEEEEAKAGHKKRTVTADVKKVSGGLTRFGDSHERKSNLQKSFSEKSTSNTTGLGSSQQSSTYVPKLNRNF